MHFTDLVRLAFNGVTARKIRSGLTMLGIIIGAAAFVALVTLGSTVEGIIEAELEALDTDQVRIVPGITEPIPGDPNAIPPQDDDLRFTAQQEQAVRGTVGVVAVHAQIDGRAAVTFRGETVRLGLHGVDPANWVRVQDPDIAEGRVLQENEGRSVVIGKDVTQLFDFPIGLNQQIDINGQRYRVVGILDSSSEQLYVTRDQAWELLGESGEPRSQMVVLRSTSIDDEVLREALTQSLLRARGLNPEDQDFTIITPEDVQESLASVTGTIQAFLGSIAAISLLVGGIGIANTMFMTVMERAKQIGILKAVGMTRREVVELFLLESALLGFLGGLIGSLLGSLGALFLSPPAGPAAGERVIAEPDPFIIAGMTLLSVLIGSLAGVLPAIRAASVPAMESLQGP